jgi:murein DD-endopeptidase MepM/ murein hydrolase activator NlpD
MPLLSLHQIKLPVYLYPMRGLTAILSALILSSCGVQHQFRKTSEVSADTTYVYSLPYPKGVSSLVIQGYNSLFSHRDRLSLDFLMKTGSEVTAARGGVVVGLTEGFTEGGTKKKYYRKGNYVTVRHSDGSQAYYGHLQHNGVLVNIGDTVRQGQVIAKSGSTGYSATPHLHFMVWGPTPKGRSQLPTRFKTQYGIMYLKPGKKYKSVD